MLPYGDFSVKAEETKTTITYQAVTIDQPLEIEKDEEQLGQLENDATIYVAEDTSGQFLLQWGPEEIMLSSSHLETYQLEEVQVEVEEEEQEKHYLKIPEETVLYQEKSLEDPVGEIYKTTDLEVISVTGHYIELVIGAQSFYLERDSIEIENALLEKLEQSAQQQDPGEESAAEEAPEAAEGDTSGEEPETSESEPAEEEASGEQPAEKEEATPDKEETAAENEQGEEEAEQDKNAEQAEASATEEKTPAGEGRASMQSSSFSLMQASRDFTASDQYFEVTQSNLTVYDNSTGKLVSIGKLREGQVFKRTGDLGNWHRIQFGEKNGYVWKDATKPASPDTVNNWTASQSHTMEARALENLTVYDNSSGSLVYFAQLWKNEKFKYIRQAGNWAIIEIGGRKGFIYAPAMAEPFEEDNGYFELLENRVPVYADRNGNKQTGHLRTGQAYQIIDSDSMWHHIEIAGEKRYVEKAKTKPAKRSQEQNWYNPGSYNSQELIAHEGLTVSDNSSGSLVAFGYINKGETFRYVSSSGNWVIIDYGGRKGFVYKPATGRPFNDSDNYFEVLQNNLTIYDNSTGSLVAVGSLPKGAVIERVRDYGNWHEFQFGDKYGYVWEASTKPASKPPKLSNNPTYQSSRITLETRATVYDNSTGSLISFANLNAGQSYPYIRKEGNWYVIELGGRIGYLYDSAVESRKTFMETHYSTSFSEMVNIQSKRTPKLDGAGRFIASKDLVAYYANSGNFDRSSNEFLQFLLLSESTNLDSAADIRKINQHVLKGKGSLEGTAQAFVEAGKRYNINEVYLIAHTLHETGNGRSTLASGVTVNGRTTYNMYGVGAYDSCPVECGSQYAYEQGWFTPEAAIIGGAKYAADRYINRGQDTLYKMRWNPDNPGHHQYATHVSWAVIQTRNMSNIYDLLDSYTLKFDIPVYRNQPASTPMPTGADQYSVNRSAEGAIAKATANVNMRQGPTTSFGIIRTLNSGEEVEIIGSNGGWYKVKDNGNRTGWVSGNYLEMKNQLRITASVLNVRSQPSTAGSVVGQVQNGDFVTGVVNSNGNYVKQNGWYKIELNGSQAWVSGSYVDEM